MSFRFESLPVWPLALEYVDACFTLADKFPQRVQFSLGEQLRRAAVSITANIAEGAGKSTGRSEQNFYDIARGSVAETMGILALAHRRAYVSDDHYQRMHNRANLVSSMLLGLSHSDFDPERIAETGEPYAVSSDLTPIFASERPAEGAPPSLRTAESSSRQLGDPSPWRTLATREVFHNRWIGVEVDDVELPGGQRYEYTRLRPAGVGVAVLGFNQAGEVLLEREYRHGVGQVIWQLPGGLSDPGEDLQAAGLRELQEETGYAPVNVTDETVRYLGSVWDNPGFGPMTSHVFAAWGLEETSDTNHDHGEYVTSHWVTFEWLKDAIANGEIKDRVVVAAAAWMLIGYGDRVLSNGVLSNE